eukprot:s3270_g6.t1
MPWQRRPADWTYCEQLRKSELPTYGCYSLGASITSREGDIPQWNLSDLLDGASTKGKGQQEILLALQYKGARDHLALKAGGSDMVQLQCAVCGVVRSAEKYTVARSEHCTIESVVVVWDDLSFIRDRQHQPLRPLLIDQNLYTDILSAVLSNDANQGSLSASLQESRPLTSMRLEDSLSGWEYRAQSHDPLDEAVARLVNRGRYRAWRALLCRLEQGIYLCGTRRVRVRVDDMETQLEASEDGGNTWADLTQIMTGAKSAVGHV